MSAVGANRTVHARASCHGSDLGSGRASWAPPAGSGAEPGHRRFFSYIQIKSELIFGHWRISIRLQVWANWDKFGTRLCVRLWSQQVMVNYPSISPVNALSGVISPTAFGLLASPVATPRTTPRNTPRSTPIPRWCTPFVGVEENMDYALMINFPGCNMEEMLQDSTLLGIDFTTWCYASALYAVIVCPSVRLSVCHKPALCQNG